MEPTEKELEFYKRLIEFGKANEQFIEKMENNLNKIQAHIADRKPDHRALFPLFALAFLGFTLLVTVILLLFIM